MNLEEPQLTLNKYSDEIKSILLKKYIEAKTQILREHFIGSTPQSQLEKEPIEWAEKSKIGSAANHTQTSGFSNIGDISIIPSEEDHENREKDNSIHENLSMFSTAKYSRFNERFPQLTHHSKNNEVESKIKRTDLSCVSCGMINLKPPFSMCKECEIGLCTNCEMIGDYHHFPNNPVHELSKVEKSFTNSSVLNESEMKLQRSRTSIVKDRKTQIKELNEAVSFSTKHFELEIEKDKSCKVNITVRNTKDIVFPNDTVIKCLSDDFTEMLEVGPLQQKQEKVVHLEISNKKLESGTISTFRLFSEKFQYFGQYLILSIDSSTKQTDKSKLVVKITIKPREEMHVDGTLIKIYSCFDSSKLSSHLTLSGNTVRLDQNMEHSVVFDNVILNQEGDSKLDKKMKELLDETVTSIFNERSVLIMNETPSGDGNGVSLVIDGDIVKNSFIYKVADALVSHSENHIVEFACFKMNHDKLLDLNDNLAVKNMILKQVDKRYLIENLKLIPVTGNLSAFEKLINDLFTKKKQETMNYHWIYLLNVYPKQKKKSRVTYLIIDLAKRFQSQNNNATDDEVIKNKKSIDESFKSLKQLIIWLGTTHQNMKYDTSMSRSYITNIIEYYMMNACDIKYIFDLRNLTDDNSMRNILTIANQLKRCKVQI